jgi:glycosyltransferase involved in cell wall biosynthesis
VGTRKRDQRDVSPCFKESVNLSAVIIAKNEEANIGHCLRALAWCDDVLVVDDGSVDGTARVAEEAGARVVQHPFESFARQRNWALDYGLLRHPWVLMLDADEVVTPELRAELEQRLPQVSDDVVGFLMCRKTIFYDRWLRYSDGFPVWILRLVRNGRVRFLDAGHGEVPVPPVDGRLEKLLQPFLHSPFSKGLGEWFSRHNRYAGREAELEFAAPAGVPWRQLWSWQRPERREAQRALSRRLPFRPQLRFWYHYLGKRGFLDGRAGYAYAKLMAIYEAMIVLKRDELQRAAVSLASVQRAVDPMVPTEARTP